MPSVFPPADCLGSALPCPAKRLQWSSKEMKNENRCIIQLKEKIAPCKC
jgi:hypothetical protein